MEDAPALLDLSESIGWPHVLGDWQTALAASEIFGQRDVDGKVVSSSAVYSFGPQLAALALVLVREEFRRRGLARAAIVRCLEQVPGVPVTLVATEFGQPLYESMGFQTVEQIVRLVRPEGASFGSRGGVEAMATSHFSDALELDRLAYAVDRSQVLRARWAQAEGGVMLSDRTGFAWKTVQRRTLVIGPVIAPDASAAARLVGELTAGFQGRVKVEVPERHAKFMDELKSGGFVIDSTRPLMLKRAKALPGRRELIFGLASLGYG